MFSRRWGLPRPGRRRRRPPVQQASPEEKAEQDYALAYTDNHLGLEALRDQLVTPPAAKTSQADLAKSLTDMAAAAEAGTYDVALGHLNAALRHAETMTAAVDAASKVFADKYNPLAARKQAALDLLARSGAEKTAQAKVKAADGAIDAAMGAADYAAATGLIDPLVAALGGLDAAVKQGIESKIGLLDGWPEAATEAARLRSELAKLGGEPVGHADRVKLTNEADAAVAGWRDVRLHAYEMGQLKTEFGCLARIPGKGVSGHALKPKWDAYEAALAKAAPPADTTGHDKLGELRDAYAKAGAALQAAHQPGIGLDDEYWKVLWLDRDKTNRQLLQKAGCVKLTTAAMTKLKQDMDALTNAPFTNRKQRYLNFESAYDKAKQLIAARTQAADQAEVDFFAAWRKVQGNVEAAGKVTDTTQPTAAAIVAFNLVHGPFATALAEARYGDCTAALTDLAAKAETVLAAKTTAMKNEVTRLGTLPEGTGGEKTAKSEAARSAIAGADEAVLARLTADEKLALLDALRKQPVPPYDKNAPGNAKRAAMCKVYGAISLDEGFVAADGAKRKEMIEALAAKKEEFKAARENWATLSNDQKEAIMQMAVEEQCKTFGFAAPVTKMVIKDFSTAPATEKLDENDNGHYNPHDDVIRINTGQPVYHDFELALDLIFHENSHNYQFKLIKQLDAGALTTDPPLTQAKLFKATWNDGRGYVGGEENYKVYQKQPLEEHAWSAGPQSAQMLMDLLAKPE